MVRLLLAARAARLAAALAVIARPIAYQRRVDVALQFSMKGGQPSVRTRDLSYRDMLRDPGARRERLVLVWWAAAALMLAWAELERRGSLRAERAAPWARGAVLVVATLALFLRKIEMFRIGRLEPRPGVLIIDLAAVAFLLLSFFAWTSHNAARRRAASRPPTVSA
jgi:hypothetical protein